MWNLKKNKKELIYKTNKLMTLKTNLWLPKGKCGWGREWVGSLGLAWHTIVYGMDGQWEPPAQHRELCSIFCDNLYGKRI